MKLSDLDSHILFEDASLIVLDKPAGWVVNRSRTYAGPTVQDWMEEKLRSQLVALSYQKNTESRKQKAESVYEYGIPEEIFAARSGVVHRLDKDTSGILLLAKNPEVLAELMRQFRQREIEKVYTALVHGKVSPSEGIIRLPMDRSSGDKLKFAVSADGKMSETQYRSLEYFPGLPIGMHQRKGKSYQGFSLMQLFPKTGRTHQIRVHMSAMKHPLVGDATYAGRKRTILDAEWCPRQFLHANKLCFTHPVSKERLCFESKLPEDLQTVLNKLITDRD